MTRLSSPLCDVREPDSSYHTHDNAGSAELFNEGATLVLEKAVKPVEQKLTTNQLLFLGRQLHDLVCGTTDASWHNVQIETEGTSACEASHRMSTFVLLSLLTSTSE